jgi:hypothetical protein
MPRQLPVKINGHYPSWTTWVNPAKPASQWAGKKAFLPAGEADARRSFRQMSLPARKAWMAAAVREASMTDNEFLADAVRWMYRWYPELRTPEAKAVASRKTAHIFVDVSGPWLDMLMERRYDWGLAAPRDEDLVD